MLNSFSNWFRVDEAANVEYQEGLVASFFSKRIAEAVKKFFEEDRRESLPYYLSQIVTGDVKDDVGVFPIPSQIGRVSLTPDFSGWKVELKPANERTYAFAGAGNIGIPYDKSVLRNAQSFEDPAVDGMLSRMDDQLVHECSHISTSKIGDDATIKGKPYWERFQKGSPEYAEAQIKYYTDPGEVRAHARQYANIYLKRYGSDFDRRKFEQMAWSDNKLHRFVNRLRDKGVQGQFPQLSERMSKAYSDFMSSVEYFVDQGRIIFS
jgi:hypothetical protein